MINMAESIFLFDSHFLFAVFLFILLVNLSAFICAYVLQVDYFTDITGSVCFVAAVLIPFAWGGGIVEIHRIAIFAAIVISRLELGCFLLYRVIKRGHDSRFETMRSNFIRFGIFWIIQIMWVFVVSFNAVFTLGDTARPSNNVATIIGICFFVVGFVIQTTADAQKLNFRKNSSNSGLPCVIGIWRYSRHPNYFGEILIWWSIFTISIPVLLVSSDKWGWATIISPIFTMFLLMFVSGIPFAEGKALERYYRNHRSRKIIEEYQNSTSPLIPFFPQVYRKLPSAVKIVLFGDFPMYRYRGTIDSQLED
ncbi:hypothetical protein IE077_003956 [Cardiosporidium cionae]|uniref:Steroid 5-alpha reductase C-terminal domain-containing protein n=1 Tax=Cardiosporidium cionae TaxID=476202 RepID=A0ABQ7J763_9APIC|nr:hypothetical protein IE077_003956 [Cardiosporidium cionae]|eukprot:KAF8819816.1 hypothetical protein IE077_003956 [Cardiosporidium cionae]